MNNRFTPATIGELTFSIPIYQRLFEWEEEQVNQLLSDLYKSSKEGKENPYYIGVLTVFKEADRYSLVDGQQRFTVLMLLGIVLKWDEFLVVNNQLRLSFFARKNDENYLKSKLGIENSNGYSNAKMNACIKTIESFFENEKIKNDLNDFKTYIKKNTTFFLSELPSNYSPVELNRYFEAMNEAGKGLENHEIVKVKLLKKLNEEDMDLCTKIWNAVSDMDKCLVRQKEEENNSSYKKRVFDFFKNQNSLFDAGKLESNENNTTIKVITASPIQPNKKDNHREEKAVIDFQEFLLLVLSLTIENYNAGFEKNKLIKSFEALENQPKIIKSFFDNLLKYRLLFDYFVIRTTSSDGRSNTYFLNYNDEQEQNKKSVIHYQSLLIVSTSYSIWLIPLLSKLEKVFIQNSKNNIEFLDFLKRWDNKRQLGKINLDYQSINRYWFWRLDYYLWERREEIFHGNSKNIANQYIFRSNRSIEHIAPQNPKSESIVDLNVHLLHSFGNLAMISSGQNSSLQNESFEIKKAHVASFVNGSVGWSIESLKLLKIYEFEKWNRDNVISHHNQMIEILIDSFDDHSIKSELKNLKITTDAI